MHTSPQNDGDPQAGDPSQLSRIALEHSPDPVYGIDAKGHIVYANQAACRSVQREPNEICSLSLPEIDSYCAKKGWPAFWEEIKNCGLVTIETEHQKKDGTSYPVEFVAKYVLSGGNESAIAFAHNLTEDKKAEATAREAQSRFQAIFEGVETGILVIDPELHRIVDANALALSMVGATREAVVGALCHKFVCPAEKGRCPVTDLGQIVDNSERVLLTYSGEKRAIIKTVRPVEIVGRKYLLESFLDITERKSAEKTLEERTVYLNTLIESSPLATVVMDKDERVQMSNPAFERLFLYKHEEMRGRRLEDLIIPEELASESSRFTRECLTGRNVHESARRRRKDATLVDCEVYGAPLVIAKEVRGILAQYHDVTERKQIEDEMAERHRLATLAAEVGGALTLAESLGEGLQHCADILVRNTDISFARVWTLKEKEQSLELRASAGIEAQTNTNQRLPLGQCKIGQIVSSGEAYINDNLPENLWANAPEWARREEIVSFAGYPLKVGKQVLGVAAAFSRQPLTDATLQAFEAVTHSMAQFIERKRAEEALRESENRFRTAFEEAPYGMCMTAPDGHFLYANAALCRMLGYSCEELLAGAWQKITHPDDLARSQQLATRFAQGVTATQEIEKRYVHKRGNIVWARVKISLVPVSRGGVSHFITQIEDITLRRQADRAQSFLASLVESSQDAIVGLTSDGVVASWNRGAADLYGYSAEEMIGQPVLQSVPADRREQMGEILDRIRQGKRTSGYETYSMRKDGTRIEVALAISPVFDAAGKVIGAASIARDITRQKEAEQKLKSSEGKFRQLAENISEVFWMMSPAGDKMLYVSPAYELIWGCSCESLYRNPMAWTDAIHPDDVNEAHASFARQLRGERIDSIYRIQTPVGQKWIRDRAFPVRDEAGQLIRIVGLAEDISERKLAEEKLRTSEERYRELFENASDLVYTFDLDLHITSLNRLAEKTMGYSREEAVQMSLQQLVDPRDWELVQSGIAQLVAGQPPAKLEFEIRANDGRRAKLEMNPRLICRDEKPVGIQAIARDISGRDAAEMELRQAQKLESVGRLASGIAHEINTPIQFVGDNAHFLHDSFETLRMLVSKFHELCNRRDDPAHELSAELHRVEEELDCSYLMEEIPKAIAQSVEGIDRVVTIVRAMKEFAHPENKGMVPARLNEALLSTLTVARNELKYVADVETDLGELPLVVCSLSDLNQVFLNLLVNAAHAIGDVVRGTDKRGKICVHTSTEGSMVLISISDTGAGIPEGIRNHIFDPFFTTKEVGRGTGQGLAIARSVIVDRHKGTLTFESEVGRGTTFYIRLPVAGSEAPAKEHLNS